MINIREKISGLIKNSFDQEKFASLDFSVEHPKVLEYGDYSSNIALVLAKKIEGETGKKVNPTDLANILVAKMRESLPVEVSNITVAGPGFINFHLSPDFFQQSINLILEFGQNFGKNKKLKDQTIFIEYTDPNPLKQFHIGHLMSNAIGEVFSRLYKWNGATVINACYQGDVGLHIAKTIWGMMEMGEDIPKETDELNKKTTFLGQAYVLGSKKYEEDEFAQKEIVEINKRVYENLDASKTTSPQIDELYQFAKKWSLQHFEEIYEKLGTSFQHYIMESSVVDLGMDLVKKNIGKVFEESEGAIVYKGEKVGLHTRVFINQNGLPTYETKDLGNALLKERLEKFDKSIIVTAEEQKQYFKVLFAALSEIYPKIAAKTEHISHGMMQFAEGKMSSRKGNVITGESLLEEIENKVAEKMKDKEIPAEERNKIVTDVAVAAIKYSILKQSPGKNIIFDREAAVSFEGDSGPYLQYTYTRAKSVIGKSREAKKIPNPKKIPAGWQTSKLEKILYQFPEIVEQALEEKAPNYLVTYAINLASEFNSYYGQNKILDDSEEEGYKLALVDAVMIVMKNCLTVIGIRLPEQM